MKRLIVVMMLVLVQVSLTFAVDQQEPNRFHNDLGPVIGRGLNNKSGLTFREANELADTYILATAYEIIDGIYRNAGKQQVLTSFQDPVYRVVRDVLFIILQDKISLDMKAADIVALVQTVVADKKTIAAATAAGQGVLGVADQQAASMLQDVQDDQALQDQLARLKADKEAADKAAAAAAPLPAAEQPIKPVRQSSSSGYR